MNSKEPAMLRWIFFFFFFFFIGVLFVCVLFVCVCVCVCVWLCCVCKCVCISMVTVYTSRLYIRHIHLTLTVSTPSNFITCSWVRGSSSVVRKQLLLWWLFASWGLHNVHTHTFFHFTQTNTSYMESGERWRCGVVLTEMCLLHIHSGVGVKSLSTFKYGALLQ